MIVLFPAADGDTVLVYVGARILHHPHTLELHKGKLFIRECTVQENAALDGRIFSLHGVIEHGEVIKSLFLNCKFIFNQGILGGKHTGSFHPLIVLHQLGRSGLILLLVAHKIRPVHLQLRLGTALPVG